MIHLDHLNEQRLVGRSSAAPELGLGALRAKLDTGQVNSFNTLLSQTLALSYNNLYKTGFVGQSIGAMGCAAFAPLTSASTTQQVQAYANLLIGEVIKTGGTNTRRPSPSSPSRRPRTCRCRHRACSASRA